MRYASWNSLAHSAVAVACALAVVGCSVEGPFDVAGGPPVITQEECGSTLTSLGVSYYFVDHPDIPAAVVLTDLGPGVSLVYDDPKGSETPGSLTTSCAAAIALGRTSHDLRAQGHDVTALYHVGSYADRTIEGTDIPSAHKFALAVDIRGIRMDGVRENLPDGYGGARLAALERELRDSFKLVLGPEFNAAHRDHFHCEQPSGEPADSASGFEVVRPVGHESLYALEGEYLHRIHSFDSYVAMGAPPIRELDAATFADLKHARSVDGSDRPLLKSASSVDVFEMRDGGLWLFDDEAAYYSCTGMSDFSSVFEQATPALLARWSFDGTLYAGDCDSESSHPSTDEDGDGIPNDVDLIRHAADTTLCLRRSTFPPDEAGPFSVVGDGMGGWGFDPTTVATVSGEWLCFDFRHSGSYRVTWRTTDDWAQYGDFCEDHRDHFCTRDPSGTFGIGFYSTGIVLHPTIGDEGP